MAGTVAVRSTNSLSDEWEICFARFIPLPHSITSSSSSSDLHPLPHRLRNRSPRGTWISSSTSAFLRFSSDLSFSDVILTVSFNAKLLVTPHSCICFIYSDLFKTELLLLLLNRCNCFWYSEVKKLDSVYSEFYFCVCVLDRSEICCVIFCRKSITFRNCIFRGLKYRAILDFLQGELELWWLVTEIPVAR
jgi:hypothetical protein